MNGDRTYRRLLAFWTIFTALGLLLVAGFANAGDVASSEAKGELGIGVDDNEDEGDQGLKTLAAEIQEEVPEEVDVTLTAAILAVFVGAVSALGVTLILFFAFYWRKR